MSRWTPFGPKVTSQKQVPRGRHRQHWPHEDDVVGFLSREVAEIQRKQRWEKVHKEKDTDKSCESTLRPYMPLFQDPDGDLFVSKNFHAKRAPENGDSSLHVRCFWIHGRRRSGTRHQEPHAVKRAGGHACHRRSFNEPRAQSGPDAFPTLHVDSLWLHTMFQARQLHWPMRRSPELGDYTSSG